MGTRAENETDPGSCLNKAAPDEPIFVLRSSDPIGAAVVRFWASLALQHGLHGETKVIDAVNLARTMDDWREANKGADDGA